MRLALVGQFFGTSTVLGLVSFVTSLEALGHFVPLLICTGTKRLVMLIVLVGLIGILHDINSALMITVPA